MASYHAPEPPISFAPPVYHCRRAKEPLRLDGDLSKSFWKDAPWTGDFRDIEGEARPVVPRFRTRAKILWDDTAIYIGAELMGDEIWGSVTKRDTTIFVDNDFEIFIDPDSDTHVYCEYEMNALNTVWDLLLTKPYRDGGRFLNSFDVKGLESAVLIDGKINNPNAKSRKWSVEVKMPFQSLLECCGQSGSPKPGDFWRMNFSRVQWPVDIVNNEFKKRIDPATNRPMHEDNWVWAPTGVINIHYPEFWGFVFFCQAGEGYTVPRDETLKWELRRIYYKLHAAFDETGRFPRNFPVEGKDITVQTTDYDFTVFCPSSDGKGRIIMRTDGKIERVDVLH